jgi:hypothetical protein
MPLEMRLGKVYVVGEDHPRMRLGYTNPGRRVTKYPNLAQNVLTHKANPPGMAPYLAPTATPINSVLEIKAFE